MPSPVTQSAWIGSGVAVLSWQALTRSRSGHKIVVSFGPATTQSVEASGRQPAGESAGRLVEGSEIRQLAYADCRNFAYATTQVATSAVGVASSVSSEVGVAVLFQIGALGLDADCGSLTLSMLMIAGLEDCSCNKAVS